jgi:hypothetical protein
MEVGCDAIIVSDITKSRHGHSDFIVYTATTRAGAASLFSSHIHSFPIRVFHANGYDHKRKSNTYQYNGLYFVKYVTQVDHTINGEIYVSHVNTDSYKECSLQAHRRNRRNKFLQLSRGEEFCFYMIPNDIDHHQRKVAHWTKCTI